MNQPVHSALIADFYSPRARVKAFGIYNVAFTAGAALGAVGAGVLGELLGWRAPFFILAIPTVVVLLVALRLLTRRGTGSRSVEETSTPPFRQTARRLWAVRSLRYQWIGGAYATGSVLGISILVPFFLEDEFGVGPGWRGVITGIGTALAAVAVLAGTAVDATPARRQAERGLRMLCWSGVVAAVALMLLSVAPYLSWSRSSSGP